MRDFGLLQGPAEKAKRMSKREYRRSTAEQKLEILRETEQPGVTVSEVCRRHSLSPSVLCRWRAVAQSGSTVALKRNAQRKPRKDDAEIERLHAGVAECIFRLMVNKVSGAT